MCRKSKTSYRASSGSSILSHLFTGAVAFSLGSVYRASSSPSLACQPVLHETTNKNVPEDIQLVDGSAPKKRQAVLAADCPNQQAEGLGRVGRDDFFGAFPFGMPLDPKDKNDVLMLYHQDSQISAQNTMMTVSEAVKDCDIVKVVLAAQQDPRTCIAVAIGQQRESYHIHKFTRRHHHGENKDDDEWDFVSRYEAALLQNPPKPVTTRESLHLMQNYLSIQDTVLDELGPLAEKVASAHKNKTVVIMVCNAGHLELLVNFCCAARAIGMDLSTSILLFATDARTKAVADQLKLVSYYNKQLFAAIPSDDNIEYGTKQYAHVMMSKVYCVHLISTLGYDLLFQDVDIVPYHKKYLENFVAASRNAGNYDMYFQYDHSMAAQYLPWSANSGFYYAKSNPKTRYFFSVLLRLSDMILRSKSHQATMAVLLSEHASLFGLRVKTLHEESHNYPGE